MLKRILAPTDGSPDAERATRLAAQIARAHDAELVLVFMINQPPLALGQSLGSPIESSAESYLSDTEQEMTLTGINVHVRLERGESAHTLIECEREEAADLVVMATHGRTGWVRLALGSVADRLVREGSAPVLLVRRSTEPPGALSSAMVMLDGSGFGERALALSAELAGKPLRSITLFRAVGRPDDRQAAEVYLQGAAARFPHEDVVIETVVEVGDARHIIERAAISYDLVILATHGRGGLDRWRHGSVADHVIGYVDRPILLVRAATSEARSS
jgi:nucleotide-binding universal stress UspA family protein